MKEGERKGEGELGVGVGVEEGEGKVLRVVGKVLGIAFYFEVVVD